MQTLKILSLGFFTMAKPDDKVPSPPASALTDALKNNPIPRHPPLGGK